MQEVQAPSYLHLQGISTTRIHLASALPLQNQLRVQARVLRHPPSSRLSASSPLPSRAQLSSVLSPPQCPVLPLPCFATLPLWSTPLHPPFPLLHAPCPGLLHTPVMGSWTRKSSLSSPPAPLLLLFLFLSSPSQTKQATLPEDASALRSLCMGWNQPASLSSVWMSPDPCLSAAQANGLFCTPLIGNESWSYVSAIHVNSDKNHHLTFDVVGPISSNAFTNGKLSRLQAFDVSYQSLTGSIPDTLSNIISLTYLNLMKNQLTGSIPSTLSTLTGLKVFWVAMNNLTNSIPPSLASLAPNLKTLNLGFNSLYGTIPDFLTTIADFRSLNLAYNQFSQSIPSGFATLVNLTGLYLQGNFLTGSIPDAFGSFQSLIALKLSYNQLTGTIPDSLTKVTTLSILVLNNNQLTGQVPPGLASLPNLRTLSLQDNAFTGSVGPAFSKFPQGFLFNPSLCANLSGGGYQACDCTDGLTGQQQCTATGPGPCVCPEGALPASEAQQGGLSTTWIVIISIGAAMLLALVVAGTWWGYKTSFGRKKGGGWEYAGKIRSFPDVRAYRSQAYDPDEIEGYGVSTYDPSPASRESSSIDYQAPPAPSGTNSSSQSASSTAAAFARKFGRSLNNQLTLRQFSYDELQLATNHFSADNIVATNGSRKTYSGVLPSGTYIAVKELEGWGPSSGAGESVEAFAAAVEVFSLVRCPQLVEVLGFSCGPPGSSTRLLVYELMPNGSLDMHLHDLDSNTQPLDWNVRMSIALATAKALAYLHSMSPQMVHQQLQASTVLLDDHFHAKVSEYCLDSLRPSHNGSVPNAASSNVAVAAGTAAPELAWSSQPTPRTDVYAFGVLLLEIISGRRPIDSNKPPTEQSLVRWVKPRLTERSQVEGMVDLKLNGNYSAAALYQVALLASQCIQSDPEARPSMSQAVDVLQNVQGLPLDTFVSAR